MLHRVAPEAARLQRAWREQEARHIERSGARERRWRRLPSFSALRTGSTMRRFATLQPAARTAVPSYRARMAPLFARAAHAAPSQTSSGSATASLRGLSELQLAKYKARSSLGAPASAWRPLLSRRGLPAPRTCLASLDLHSMRPSAAAQGVLLDQFGVLHDGQKPYPGAQQAVQLLHEAGLRVLILSNSSRRSGGTLKKLAKMGFQEEWFAGEAAAGGACSAAKDDGAAAAGRWGR